MCEYLALHYIREVLAATFTHVPTTHRLWPSGIVRESALVEDTKTYHKSGRYLPLGMCGEGGIPKGRRQLQNARSIAWLQCSSYFVFGV